MRFHNPIFMFLLIYSIYTLLGFGEVLAEDIRSISISIMNKEAIGEEVKVSGGLGVIRVNQGQNIQITWHSDQSTVLHLHGYSIKTKLPKDKDVIMEINARASGRFSIEAHGFGNDHKHKTLIYLEVLPR
jgi:hypothetical protein